MVYLAELVAMLCDADVLMATEVYIAQSGWVSGARALFVRAREVVKDWIDQPSGRVKEGAIPHGMVEFVQELQTVLESYEDNHEGNSIVYSQETEGSSELITRVVEFSKTRYGMYDDRQWARYVAACKKCDAFKTQRQMPGFSDTLFACKLYAYFENMKLATNIKEEEVMEVVQRAPLEGTMLLVRLLKDLLDTLIPMIHKAGPVLRAFGLHETGFTIANFNATSWTDWGRVAGLWLLGRPEEEYDDDSTNLPTLYQAFSETVRKELHCKEQENVVHALVSDPNWVYEKDINEQGAGIRALGKKSMSKFLTEAVARAEIKTNSTAWSSSPGPDKILYKTFQEGEQNKMRLVGRVFGLPLSEAAGYQSHFSNTFIGIGGAQGISNFNAKASVNFDMEAHEIADVDFLIRFKRAARPLVFYYADKTATTEIVYKEDPKKGFKLVGSGRETVSFKKADTSARTRENFLVYLHGQVPLKTDLTFVFGGGGKNSVCTVRNEEHGFQRVGEEWPLGDKLEVLLVGMNKQCTRDDHPRVEYEGQKLFKVDNQLCGADVVIDKLYERYKSKIKNTGYPMIVDGDTPLFVTYDRDITEHPNGQEMVVATNVKKLTFEKIESDPKKHLSATQTGNLWTVETNDPADKYVQCRTTSIFQVMGMFLKEQNTNRVLIGTVSGGIKALMYHGGINVLDDNTREYQGYGPPKVEHMLAAEDCQWRLLKADFTKHMEGTLKAQKTTVNGLEVPASLLLDKLKEESADYLEVWPITDPRRGISMQLQLANKRFVVLKHLLRETSVTECELLNVWTSKNNTTANTKKFKCSVDWTTQQVTVVSASGITKEILWPTLGACLQHEATEILTTYNATGLESNSAVGFVIIMSGSKRVVVHADNTDVVYRADYSGSVPPTDLTVTDGTGEIMELCKWSTSDGLLTATGTNSPHLVTRVASDRGGDLIRWWVKKNPKHEITCDGNTMHVPMWIDSGVRQRKYYVDFTNQKIVGDLGCSIPLEMQKAVKDMETPNLFYYNDKKIKVELSKTNGVYTVTNVEWKVNRNVKTLEFRPVIAAEVAVYAHKFDATNFMTSYVFCNHRCYVQVGQSLAPVSTHGLQPLPRGESFELSANHITIKLPLGSVQDITVAFGNDHYEATLDSVYDILSRRYKSKHSYKPDPDASRYAQEMEILPLKYGARYRFLYVRNDYVSSEFNVQGFPSWKTAREVRVMENDLRFKIEHGTCNSELLGLSSDEKTLYNANQMTGRVVPVDYLSYEIHNNMSGVKYVEVLEGDGWSTYKKDGDGYSHMPKQTIKDNLFGKSGQYELKIEFTGSRADITNTYNNNSTKKYSVAADSVFHWAGEINSHVTVFYTYNDSHPRSLRRDSDSVKWLKDENAKLAAGSKVLQRVVLEGFKSLTVRGIDVLTCNGSYRTVHNTQSVTSGYDAIACLLDPEVNNDDDIHVTFMDNKLGVFYKSNYRFSDVTTLTSYNTVQGLLNLLKNDNYMITTALWEPTADTTLTSPNWRFEKKDDVITVLDNNGREEKRVQTTDALGAIAQYVNAKHKDNKFPFNTAFSIKAGDLDSVFFAKKAKKSTSKINFTLSYSSSASIPAQRGTPAEVHLYYYNDKKKKMVHIPTTKDPKNIRARKWNHLAVNVCDDGIWAAAAYNVYKNNDIKQDNRVWLHVEYPNSVKTYTAIKQKDVAVSWEELPTQSRGLENVVRGEAKSVHKDGSTPQFDVHWNHKTSIVSVMDNVEVAFNALESIILYRYQKATLGDLLLYSYVYSGGYYYIKSGSTSGEGVLTQTNADADKVISCRQLPVVYTHNNEWEIRVNQRSTDGRIVELTVAKNKSAVCILLRDLYWAFHELRIGMGLYTKDAQYPDTLIFMDRSPVYYSLDTNTFSSSKDGMHIAVKTGLSAVVAETNGLYKLKQNELVAMVSMMEPYGAGGWRLRWKEDEWYDYPEMKSAGILVGLWLQVHKNNNLWEQGMKRTYVIDNGTLDTDQKDKTGFLEKETAALFYTDDTMRGTMKDLTITAKEDGTVKITKTQKMGTVPRDQLGRYLLKLGGTEGTINGGSDRRAAVKEVGSELTDVVSSEAVTNAFLKKVLNRNIDVGFITYDKDYIETGQGSLRGNIVTSMPDVTRDGLLGELSKRDAHCVLFVTAGEERLFFFKSDDTAANEKKHDVQDVIVYSRIITSMPELLKPRDNVRVEIVSGMTTPKKGVIVTDHLVVQLHKNLDKFLFGVWDGNVVIVYGTCNGKQYNRIENTCKGRDFLMKGGALIQPYKQEVYTKLDMTKPDQFTLRESAGHVEVKIGNDINFLADSRWALAVFLAMFKPAESYLCEEHGVGYITLNANGVQEGYEKWTLAGDLLKMEDELVEINSNETTGITVADGILREGDLDWFIGMKNPLPAFYAYLHKTRPTPTTDSIFVCNMRFYDHIGPWLTENTKRHGHPRFETLSAKGRSLRANLRTRASFEMYESKCGEHGGVEIKVRPDLCTVRIPTDSDTEEKTFQYLRSVLQYVVSKGRHGDYVVVADGSSFMAKLEESGTMGYMSRFEGLKGWKLPDCDTFVCKQIFVQTGLRSLEKRYGFEITSQHEMWDVVVTGETPCRYVYSHDETNRMIYDLVSKCPLEIYTISTNSGRTFEDFYFRGGGAPTVYTIWQQFAEREMKWKFDTDLDGWDDQCVYRELTESRTLILYNMAGYYRISVGDYLDVDVSQKNTAAMLTYLLGKFSMYDTEHYVLAGEKTYFISKLRNLTVLYSAAKIRASLPHGICPLCRVKKGDEVMSFTEDGRYTLVSSSNGLILSTYDDTAQKTDRQYPFFSDAACTVFSDEFHNKETVLTVVTSHGAERDLWKNGRFTMQSDSRSVSKDVELLINGSDVIQGVPFANEQFARFQKVTSFTIPKYPIFQMQIQGKTTAFMLENSESRHKYVLDICGALWDEFGMTDDYRIFECKKTDGRLLGILYYRKGSIATSMENIEFSNLIQILSRDGGYMMVKQTESLYKLAVDDVSYNHTVTLRDAFARLQSIVQMVTKKGMWVTVLLKTRHQTVYIDEQGNYATRDYSKTITGGEFVKHGDKTFVLAVHNNEGVVVFLTVLSKSDGLFECVGTSHVGTMPQILYMIVEKCNTDGMQGMCIFTVHDSYFTNGEDSIEPLRNEMTGVVRPGLKPDEMLISNRSDANSVVINTDHSDKMLLRDIPKDSIEQAYGYEAGDVLIRRPKHTCIADYIAISKLLKVGSLTGMESFRWGILKIGDQDKLLQVEITDDSSYTKNFRQIRMNVARKFSRIGTADNGELYHNIRERHKDLFGFPIAGPFKLKGPGFEDAIVFSDEKTTFKNMPVHDLNDVIARVTYWKYIVNETERWLTSETGKLEILTSKYGSMPSNTVKIHMLELPTNHSIIKKENGGWYSNETFICPDIRSPIEKFEYTFCTFVTRNGKMTTINAAGNEFNHSQASLNIFGDAKRSSGLIKTNPNNFPFNVQSDGFMIADSFPISVEGFPHFVKTLISGPVQHTNLEYTNCVECNSKIYSSSLETYCNLKEIEYEIVNGYYLFGLTEDLLTMKNYEIQDTQLVGEVTDDTLSLHTCKYFYKCVIHAATVYDCSGDTVEKTIPNKEYRTLKETDFTAHSGSYEYKKTNAEQYGTAKCTTIDGFSDVSFTLLGLVTFIDKYFDSAVTFDVKIHGQVIGHANIHGYYTVDKDEFKFSRDHYVFVCDNNNTWYVKDAGTINTITLKEHAKIVVNAGNVYKIVDRAVSQIANKGTTFKMLKAPNYEARADGIVYTKTNGLEVGKAAVNGHFAGMDITLKGFLTVLGLFQQSPVLEIYDDKGLIGHVNYTGYYPTQPLNLKINPTMPVHAMDDSLQWTKVQGDTQDLRQYNIIIHDKRVYAKVGDDWREMADTNKEFKVLKQTDYKAISEDPHIKYTNTQLGGEAYFDTQNLQAARITLQGFLILLYRVYNLQPLMTIFSDGSKIGTANVFGYYPDEKVEEFKLNPAKLVFAMDRNLFWHVLQSDGLEGYKSLTSSYSYSKGTDLNVFYVIINNGNCYMRTTPNAPIIKLCGPKEFPTLGLDFQAEGYGIYYIRSNGQDIGHATCEIMTNFTNVEITLQGFYILLETLYQQNPMLVVFDLFGNRIGEVSREGYFPFTK